MAKSSRALTWTKRALIVLMALVVACCVGFVAYASQYYAAGQTAVADVAAGAAGDASVAVTQTSREIAVGDPSSSHGLVLYPGAKVDPQAYVPLAVKLADRGVFCVIAKMPLNFAFFDMGAAGRVVTEYPQVGTWWVGGHSLGGAMAAQWAAGHAGEVGGIVLLGSYAACDLSQTGLAAEVIYGSSDGVLNRQKLADCAGNLPPDARTLVIEGGNHAGFGDYGSQAGDGEAAISADEQQEQTAREIASAMAA